MTKVSKSESHTMTDHGTYDGETVGGTANGIPDGDGETTYTIVVGDGTTTLDGVRVTDTMSGDQQLILDSFQMTGSNVTVGNWKPYGANATPTMWNQQVFDFTFPAGTGTGPVTITYKTRPFTSNQAKEAGIYGKRTFTNKVYTSTDEDTVGVDYEYPEKVPFSVTKTSEPSSETSVQPDSSVTYTINYGSTSDDIAGLNIIDEMTDLQKLKVKSGDTYNASPVTVSFPTNGLTAEKLYGTIGYGTAFEATKNGDAYTFTMPVASNGWGNDGVTWSHFDDDSYNTNMVRVFNFTFPSEFFSDADKRNKLEEGAVKGPVTVTYSTIIITEDEAKNSGITGLKDALNTATAQESSSTTTVKPEFPKNLNHNPNVSKSFSGWDDDGYTTWWDIDVRADDGSTYPLEDLTLTEDWASGSVYYTTDWPVQNYKKNDLLDFDLLGATVTAESGTVLQPGRDYTIDKEAGAFKFKKLAEGVSIHIAIHNPDATINTFYQHNQVKLTWKKDAYNTGEKTADATGRRVKQEVDLTKSGTYDPNTHTITWKVIFNPYSKPVVPEWNKIQFVDTLAEGLELTGDIDVEIAGAWQNYKIENAKINSKVAQTQNADKTTTITIDDLDPHERWGSHLNGAKYYHKTGDDWTEIQANEYPTGEVDTSQYKKVEGIGLGLSGNTYNVTYKTLVTDEKWEDITSSRSGKEVFQNNVKLVNGDGSKDFTASNKVTVEGTDYLHKHDVTKEDSDGYVIDAEEMHDNSISYEVDINPKKLTLNHGKTLTLTDRIDTIMEIDTDSVKVYAYEGEGDAETATELSHEQLANMGISISYNDDTRQLAVSGIPDARHLKVAYKTVSRAMGFSTFSNTATLIGGGAHSDKVSDQHGITNDGESFWGNRHPYIDLKKIDENDITHKLQGAQFSLYKVVLKNSEQTKSWTRADWMDLLEKAESGDAAVLEQIKKDFVQVGKEPIGAGRLVTDEDGMQMLEYEIYPTSPGADDGTYLQEHTVYYWEETDAPEGYKITNKGAHYFVLYLDGELDDDYTQEDQRKKAAWALDDAATIAYGWTIASMASDTEWKVNDTRKGITSITATKRWEGDYDDTYETRPKDGILLDLYRVDRQSGKQTLMEDLSPVPINADEDGNWSSFTWYNLDDAYNYTVKERPVPGYITSYSDKGEGQEDGTITVTNTFVPKSTDIYVEKRWDPEDKPKPSEVKVQLYRIVYETGEDGVARPGEPESMGNDFATMLTAGNDWKHVWKGLDTKDPDGNMIAYTVVEDVTGVNETPALKANKIKYGAVYSDGGQGVVTTSEDDPLVIINLENAPGSLKITKNVTVNGESVSDTAADGVYTFRLMRVNDDGTEVPAYHMHDHDENCTGAAHDQYLVTQDELKVEIRNGKAASIMVDNLEESTYYVQESTPGNGTKVVEPANNTVELKVVAGVTSEETAPEAAFTNNAERNRVEVTKKWVGSEGGTTTWLEGMEVQVKLMVKDDATGTLSDVTWPSGQAPANWSTTVEQWLTASKVLNESTGAVTSNGPTYMWDNLPELDSGNSYVVVETDIRHRANNSVDSTGSTTADHKSSTITVGTTRYDYAITGSAKTTENKKGVDYTLTNTQVTSVTFRKQWGLNGTDAWPANVSSITVQLYEDGNAKQGAEYTKTLTKTDMAQAIPANTGYLYTFANLESGHTYSVKETAINVGGTSYDVGANNNPYLVEQIDGTTIRNVPVKTDITVNKKWLKPDGTALESWPTKGSDFLTITGNLTRQMRKYGSTLDIDWIDDNTYTPDPATFTIAYSEAGTGESIEVDKYGYIDNTLYEYRYTANETSVMAGSTDLTSNFSAESSRDGSTLTISNAPKPTEISLQKKWQKPDGTSEPEGYWPQEGGAPLAINVTINQSADNGVTWSKYAEQKVRNASVVTIYDLPQTGFSADGELVTYKYSVEEALADVPAGYAQVGSVTGTGASTDDPFVITNRPEVTSVSVAKAWQDVNGISDSWPDNVAQVTGRVKRERRTFGSDDDWQMDPWAGEQFTITNTSGDHPSPVTVGDLPTNGYDGGVHYEYRYSTAVEDPIKGYESSLETTNAGTEASPNYTHIFTNKKTDTDMNVTVEKKWVDADGNPIEGEDEATLNTQTNPQFQLHKVRYANIVVNVPTLTSASDGSIALSIFDGTNTTVAELTNDNFVDTYVGWQYVFSPLDKSKTYTVTAVGDGTVIGTMTQMVSDGGNVASLSDDVDHDWIITYTPQATPRTITVTMPQAQRTINGWVAVDLLDTNNNYIGTKTLSNDNDGANWSQTFTGLDSATNYKLRVGGFDRRYYDDASMSNDGTPTYTGNSGSATVSVTMPQDPRLKVLVPDSNLADWTNGDAGWIDIDVYQGGNTITGSPFRINKDTAWDFYKNLDGTSMYEVRINNFDRSAFGNVIIANGSGTFTGNANKEVTLQATKVASSDSIAVTVNWPESSFNWAYLQWENFNPANKNGDNSFSQSWNGSFGGSVTKNNSATISKQQTTNGDNYDYYMCYFDWNAMESNPTKIRLNCNTTMFDPNGTEIDGTSITGNQWVVFKGDVSTLTIDFLDPSTNQVMSMIPFHFLLPRVALAEETNSTQYAMVDETYGAPQGFTSGTTSVWNTLEKVDGRNQPIRYHVVETSPSSDATTYSTDGGNTTTVTASDASLSGTGTITVTNTDNSKVKVKVEKVWKDANGNEFTPEDGTQATFELKKRTVGGGGGAG